MKQPAGRLIVTAITICVMLISGSITKAWGGHKGTHQHKQNICTEKGSTPIRHYPEWIRTASINDLKSQGDNNSYQPAVSGDGRYIAFLSHARNLVPGDTNNSIDVFVHDLLLGTTERVSKGINEEEANGNSFSPTISHDGRYVAFQSFADNLIEEDTNRAADIFVYDQMTGTTKLVSINNEGIQGNQMSLMPVISADGMHVAFASMANNLAPRDTNGVYDVFIHDLDTGATERVSVSSEGYEGNGISYSPAISADGTQIAFVSYAADLVGYDANLAADVFVHDRTTGVTERISVNSEGYGGNRLSYMPDISDDGRYVSFTSWASDLVYGDTNNGRDVFVHDRLKGITFPISINDDGLPGNAESYYAAISGDGQYVVFASSADNFAKDDCNGNTDIFRHHLVTGKIERLSKAKKYESNGMSSYPSVNYNGTVVGFASLADNLVPNDTNRTLDVFVHLHKSGPPRVLDPKRAMADSSNH